DRNVTGVQTCALPIPNASILSGLARPKKALAAPLSNSAPIIMVKLYQRAALNFFKERSKLVIIRTMVACDQASPTVVIAKAISDLNDVLKLCSRLPKLISIWSKVGWLKAAMKARMIKGIVKINPVMAVFLVFQNVTCLRYMVSPLS